MARTLGIVMLLALLATLSGSAQCVVRCANPSAPPPCHHHAPVKQDPPAQVCAAPMLPGDPRADVAPAILVSIPLMALVAPVAEPRPPQLLAVETSVSPGTHAVLRI
jgi:hypothetical protein